MGIGCCGPSVSPSFTLSPVNLDIQRPWRHLERWSSSENCSKEGASLSVYIRTTTSDGTQCETSSYEGVQQATTMSSTNTSALISEDREDQRLNENNSPQSSEKKSEHDNEDKKESTLSIVTFQEEYTVDTESKVSRRDESNNYSKNLSLSRSVLAVVEPDDDYDDQQFSDIIIVGNTDAIIEKLKTENVDREKMIQELLMENKILKKSFHCGRRHVKRKSIKFREKVNEIRKRANTLPASLPSPGKEMCYSDSWIDSTNTLPDIADQPLLFRSSLHEAKEPREKNRGLPELGEKSGSWQFSQFMLL